MKSIPKIINEEVRSFLKEIDEDIHEMYEAEDTIKSEMFSDFLYENNSDFTKLIQWRLVPYSRLKKIWEDYMKTGNVRDTKGLDMIERVIIRNALRINIITNLAGHTEWGDEESFEEYIGYWVDEQLNCILKGEQYDPNQLEIPYDNPEAGQVQREPKSTDCNITPHPFAEEFVAENYDSEKMNFENIREKLYEEMKDKFLDYVTDPKSGHMYITDYGLNAIIQLTTQLYGEETPKNKITIIDRILNVVHQRSDLAGWFVQGGSSALSDLSGYEIPDNDDGARYQTKSAISGRYNMNDYRNN